jgi:hypothetical protein
MASGKRNPPGGPGSRRRRAPTIDLQATELASDPPVEPSQPDTVASAASPDWAVEPSAGAPIEEGKLQDEAPKENEPRVEAASEETPKESAASPVDEPSAVGVATEPEPAAAKPPAPEPAGASSDDLPPDRRATPASDRRPMPEPAPAGAWPLIGAGALGVVGGLAAFLLLFFVGAWPRTEQAAPSDVTNTLAPRIAAIESQVRELASRPVPQGADPKALDDLSVRLKRLEGAAAVPPAADTKILDDLSTRLKQLEIAAAAPRPAVGDPALSGRLTAAENAIKPLTDNIAALSRRNDELAATLRETGGRLDRLAATVDELQKVAHASAAGTDRAVRLAVAASSLQGAVERGDPFAAELAVAEQFAADPKALAPLAPFSAAGVPTAAALGRELPRLIQPMLTAERAAAAPRDGDGFLDRLQANAERLVRVRPIDQAPPEKSGAALARIAALAARSDLNDIVAELNKLPESARAPAQPWIAKVEARNKALETVRRFSATAIAALKPSPDR